MKKRGVMNLASTLHSRNMVLHTLVSIFDLKSLQKQNDKILHRSTKNFLRTEYIPQISCSLRMPLILKLHSVLKESLSHMPPSSVVPEAIPRTQGLEPYLLRPNRNLIASLLWPKSVHILHPIPHFSNVTHHLLATI